MSFHNGVLPREGFHADVLGSLLKYTFLNPFLTVPLALALRFHDKGRTLIAESPRILTLITGLAVGGFYRVANEWLSRRSLNNGVRDKYEWNEEVVVVTGGADGIGKSMVLMMASQNVKVAILDVQTPAYKLPSSVVFVKTDVTSPEALKSAHDTIKSRFGRDPTVIILNAGVCRGKSILDSTLADNQLTFNVNTISHYSMVRQFLPAMIKEDHGMVVTVASSAAWITAPRMVDYASTKAAALAFHEGLSAELVTNYNAPRVRTVIVNQGYTKTKLFQGFGTKPGFLAPPLESDTVAEAIVRQVLKGESGQVVQPTVLSLVLPSLRGYPAWLQHGIRVGLADVMKDWHGRQVDAIVAKS